MVYFCDVPIETYWGVAKVFACHILELCIQILGKDNNFAICSKAWNFKLVRWLVFPASCSTAQMLSAWWVMEVSLSSWQEIDKILAHIHPLPTVRCKGLHPASDMAALKLGGYSDILQCVKWQRFEIWDIGCVLQWHTLSATLSTGEVCKSGEVCNPLHLSPWTCFSTSHCISLCECSFLFIWVTTMHFPCLVRAVACLSKPRRFFWEVPKYWWEHWHNVFTLVALFQANCSSHAVQLISTMSACPPIVLCCEPLFFFYCKPVLRTLLRLTCAPPIISVSALASQMSHSLLLWFLEWKRFFSPFLSQWEKGTWRCLGS